MHNRRIKHWLKRELKWDSLHRGGGHIPPRERDKFIRREVKKRRIAIDKLVIDLDGVLDT
jgi:hypothetical protein